MSHQTDSRSSEKKSDTRKISKWARTYAQNRSLGMVVFQVIYLILSAAIAVPSYFGGVAYRDGQWLIFLVCLAILIAAMATVVYFSVPKWGGKLMERISERLYAGEGSARLATACTPGRMWVSGFLCGIFLLCVLSSVVLGLLGFLPEQYMQPISAIYVVPFLLGLWLILRPTAGPILLLWPALYTLHAVLILAGIPILFSGPWDYLNMLIPTCGYGLLVGLIAHLYSRFALRRLRRMSRGKLQDEAWEEPQP